MQYEGTVNERYERVRPVEYRIGGVSSVFYIRELWVCCKEQIFLSASEGDQTRARGREKSMETVTWHHSS